jgi:hypothetical protein
MKVGGRGLLIEREMMLLDDIQHVFALNWYHDTSTIMRKAFGWKLSRIYILEVEAVPQSCIL